LPAECWNNAEVGGRSARKRSSRGLRFRRRRRRMPSIVGVSWPGSDCPGKVREKLRRFIGRDPSRNWARLWLDTNGARIRAESSAECLLAFVDTVVAIAYRPSSPTLNGASAVPISASCFNRVFGFFEPIPIDFLARVVTANDDAVKCAVVASRLRCELVVAMSSNRTACAIW